ncbi:hypothetical protein [Desulfotomaculum sp. 1211_IL3151]|uniref:hypothetical protein n=1 Tax=Desulfotomaculum sp. 1211_IL3151 TaxID=3084055 RepID=UPI002FD99693
MVKKQEIEFTVSGHEVDKDLARVPIKVSPSLQALIANQLELMEIVEKGHPDYTIFVEQHRMELLQIEQEIAYAFNNYVQKKEKAREKREQRKSSLATEPPTSEEESPFMEAAFYGGETSLPTKDDLPWDDSPRQSAEEQNISDQGYVDERPQPSLDAMAASISPGLPSAKYEPRTAPVEPKPEVDVRRIAIGAAIKSLSKFLGRELSEEEIVQIESQVDSYLK